MWSSSTMSSSYKRLTTSMSFETTCNSFSAISSSEEQMAGPVPGVISSIFIAFTKLSITLAITSMYTSRRKPVTSSLACSAGLGVNSLTRFVIFFAPMPRLIISLTGCPLSTSSSSSGCSISSSTATFSGTDLIGSFFFGCFLSLTATFFISSLKEFPLSEPPFAFSSEPFFFDFLLLDFGCSSIAASLLLDFRLDLVMSSSPSVSIVPAVRADLFFGGGLLKM
mmetsp:Transcript_13111/g.18878  ORF Transcript_13111/g.18878 Transcript_13111/m.18878 type:complete len:224 (-) Transcript_13111:498-1169(-)